MNNIIVSCMKIFIFTMLLVFFGLMSYANIQPLSSNDIPLSSIGVYQIDKRLVIYEKPSTASRVLYDTEIKYADLADQKESYLFAVLVPKKKLGYVYVTDISDDEAWVEVLYDKVNNRKGWVYKNDEFQFMPWISFINLYGRKYGVRLLNDYDTDFNKILSQPDDSGQILGELIRPKTIRLTSVEGVWMLITALFYDGEVTTGYVQWRDTKGKIFVFPNFK